MKLGKRRKEEKRRRKKKNDRKWENKRKKKRKTEKNKKNNNKKGSIWRKGLWEKRRPKPSGIAGKWPFWFLTTKTKNQQKPPPKNQNPHPKPKWTPCRTHLLARTFTRLTRVPGSSAPFFSCLFLAPKAGKISRKCPEMAPFVFPYESQVARNSVDIPFWKILAHMLEEGQTPCAESVCSDCPGFLLLLPWLPTWSSKNTLSIFWGCFLEITSRGKNQKNPRVRKIFVRNSGAGNFMGAWKNALFLQKKPCP